MPMPKIIPNLPSDEEFEEMMKERYKTRKPSPNSALYWFPKIAKNFPVPRTEIVEFDDRTMWPALDGNPTPNIPIEAFKTACDKIGYPLFLRCDGSSAKHDGPNAYRLDIWDPKLHAFFITFEDNAMKDLEIFAFLFREWIDFDGSFTAFGGGTGNPGHLIANEWRFLATSKKVTRQFFYWPEFALEGHAHHDDWKNLLASTKKLTDEERGYLFSMAIDAAKSVNADNPEDPEWSVDFAKDKKGKWWLIDMALSKNSWKADHDD
jgi:hypothetical protein